MILEALDKYEKAIEVLQGPLGGTTMTCKVDTWTHGCQICRQLVH